MEEYLRTLLLTLGHPVAWGEFGAGTALPRLVLNTVSGSEDLTLDGPTGVTPARVQVDCYGSTYYNALLVSRAVRALLSGHAGGPVQMVKLVSIRDGRDGSGGDALQRVSLDFAVKYRA